MAAVSIPLDGLGLDDKAMLDLVNRMNKHDNRKWVLERNGWAYFNQAANTGNLFQQYQSQMGNMGNDQQIYNR